jgi:glycosyltransferase involved in cell wall biosynthesis
LVFGSLTSSAAGHGPLKVCIFAHSSSLGGADRSLLELVRRLIGRHGVSCWVVVPGEGPLVQALEAAGATCLFAKLAWWCGSASVSLSEAEKTARVKESLDALATEIMPLMRAVDPDVVWTQTLVIPWGAVTANRLNKPHVWSIREYGEKDHNLRFFWPFERILADILRGSDFIFTASRGLAAELFPGASAELIGTLYGPVSAPPDNNGTFDGFAHGDAIKLGLFGNLNASKGQMDAVSALGQLTAGGHNVELLLAGSGNSPYENDLRALAAALGIVDRVHFAGALRDPYPAMRACDIILVCSRREGFGRVAVEAMLLEKAVVYAAAGGMLETMVDGESGLAYRPGDVQGLIAQLSKLIAEPGFRRELARRAKDYAIARFAADDCQAVVDRLLELRARKTSRASMPSVLLAELPGQSVV